MWLCLFRTSRQKQQKARAKQKRKRLQREEHRTWMLRQKTKEKEKEESQIDFAQLTLETRPISSGVYGSVFQTSHPDIVCKELRHPHESLNFSSFVREMSTFSTCHPSPYLLTCVSIDAHKRRFFVPKFESSLNTFLSKKQHSEADIKFIFYQIAQGVADLHAKHIFHRDIKPDNILINSRTRKVVLCDFGLCRKFCSEWCALTSEHVQALWYRAPEILLGATRYTFKIDVWSLGLLLFRIIARKTKSFEAHSCIEQLFKFFELRGTPTKETWKGVNHFPYWSDEFPQWTTDQLGVYVQEKTSLDLLSGMLMLNPDHRFSMQEVLNHAYFDEVRQQPSVHPPPLPPTSLCASPQTFSSECMKNHPALNHLMRLILVDWLLEVSTKKIYSHETYFLGIKLLDLYLSHSFNIQRTQLQLVGATCLYLAALTCQDTSVEPQMYVYYSDHAFTEKELEEKACEVLKTLQYNLFLQTEFHTLVQTHPFEQHHVLLKRLYRCSLVFSTRSLSFEELIQYEPTPQEIPPKYTAWKLREKQMDIYFSSSRRKYSCCASE